MIRFTQPARRRLAQRAIDPSWVEAAIATPDRTEADPDPTLTRSYLAIAPRGGRILKVVHRPDGPESPFENALWRSSGTAFLRADAHGLKWPLRFGARKAAPYDSPEHVFKRALREQTQAAETRIRQKG